MAAAERNHRTAAAAVRRISTSVGAKLFTLVFAVLLLNLGLLGWANIRLHRRHLEAASLEAGERMSNVIARSIAYTMLRNDRDALRQVIDSVGKEPAITNLRIFNHEGRVTFSTSSGEVGRLISRETAECRGCHAGAEARYTLTSRERSRIFRQNGGRTLGIVTPILNSRSCTNAACHAHPASQRVLGLLDVNVPLATADESLANASWQFAGYSALAILLTLAATGLFVWQFVHKPVAALRVGTEVVGRGELAVKINIRSRDELGGLATSFNAMTSQLLEARREITAWARTLEQRVAEKTAELQSAHRHMIQAEKLTSLGKLAAVVAHEINNPLSGILTYARLLRKWIERGDSLEQRSGEMRDALQLIETESRRCGDIVQNLLAFARVTPMNVVNVDVNSLVDRCLRLIEHKLELGNISVRLDLDERLPQIQGDSGQIEQLFLALIMNAVEAMPHEGNLHITTFPSADRQNITIVIEDDGIGIPESLLPQLFEPFVTTKEEKGVGLGLAVSRSIVDRHNGRISVRSEAGRGTAFTIELPVGSAASPERDSTEPGHQSLPYAVATNGGQRD